MDKKLEQMPFDCCYETLNFSSGKKFRQSMRFQKRNLIWNLFLKPLKEAFSVVTRDFGSIIVLNRDGQIDSRYVIKNSRF